MRKQGLEDARLLDVVHEMEGGQFGASLGGCVYKKRIALSGRGKRGSVRTLIVYRSGDRAFFVYGFAKNERANIDSNELGTLKLMARLLLEKSSTALGIDVVAKILIEVKNDG